MDQSFQKRSKKRVTYLFVVLIVLMLGLSACGGTSNNNDRNGEQDNNQNNNGADENGNQKVPTDILRDTIYHEFPDSVLLMEDSETMLFYSIDGALEIRDFYQKYDSLTGVGGPREVDIYVFQTNLMTLFFDMPTNTSADDFEELFDEWEAKLENILNEEGDLMVILIISTEASDTDEFIDVVGAENIGLVPNHAKTVIRFNFGDFDS